MKHENYKPRIADAILKENLEAFGAVCVEGPMWCGKTWTATMQAASACMIGDSKDNFAVKERIAVDIDYAFDGAEPRLIDEWQVFPAIWDATRSHVDEGKGHGRFILTGSATPTEKGILHSGAGRIASMRMRPMSLWESGVSEGSVSLANVMRGVDSGVKDVKRPQLEEIIELVMRGGWPATMSDPFRIAVKTPQAYVRRLVDRDIPGMEDEKRDWRKMSLLLRSLARNESTTASNAKITSDISAFGEGAVSEKTVGQHLAFLERLFVTENIEPYAPEMRSRTRLKQAAKRHFCDPSIAAALLRATPDRLAKDLNTFGFLFESMVIRDLLCYAEAVGGSVYHYQDYKGREIDVVIDMPDGSWGGFEVKLGSNQIESAAANLTSISKVIADEGGSVPSVLGVIVGLAGAAYRPKDGVWILPITALRP